MKILLISQCPTHPSNAGNRRWTLSECEILAHLGQEVHFLYLADFPFDKARMPLFQKDLDETAAYWKERFHLFKIGKINHLRNIVYTYIRNWFNNGFYHCDDKYPIGLSKYVEKLQNKENFDICIVNYYSLSKLVERVSFPKIAINTHDCFSYKNLVVGRKYAGQMTASQEAKAMQRFPYIFALQEEEAIYFQKLSPLSKVYNLFSYTEYKKSKVVGNHTILFLSGSNQYNVNGLKWFIEEIFPLIINSFPHVKLIIGGAICSVLPQYSDERIELVGYVDNVANFYEKGDVAINPVYQGTGIKVKTIEAIAYDKITLAHPHSIIGLYKSDVTPLFVSSKPSEWVEYLQTVWGHENVIIQKKEKNREYIMSMNSYIIHEYKSFLGL